MSTIRISWSWIVGIAAAMALTAGGAAFAGSINSNFQVTASISTTCAFGTLNPLAFGTYDPLVANASSGSDLAGSTTFNIDCVNGTAVAINLDNGLHASGGERFMTSSGNKLQYTLYQDSAHTIAWDSLTAENVTGTGSSQAINLYGVLPKGQNEPIGSYADTLTVTLTY